MKNQIMNFKQTEKMKKLLITLFFLAFSLPGTLAMASDIDVNRLGPTITFPAFGSDCEIGSDCVITWTTFATSTQVRIQYKKTTSGSWTQIVTDHVTSGTSNSYTWSIPTTGLTIGDYQIEICEDLNYGIGSPNYVDCTTSSVFQIDPMPTVSVSQPFSGVHLQGGTLPIAWTTNQGSVDITLVNQGTGTSTTLFTGSTGTTANWSIPSGQAEGDYKVKVAVNGNSSVFAYSPEFRIEPKRIIVQYPFDNVIWYRSNSATFRWTQNFTGNVDIAIKDASNNTKATISGVSGTSHTWSVPTNFELRSDLKAHITASGATSINSTGTFSVKEAPETEVFTLNSSRSQTALTPITSSSQFSSLLDEERSRTLSYVDGTGRVRQSIAIEATPDKKDLVTPFVYNEIGQQDESRQAYSYTSTDGVYHTFAIDRQEDFYALGQGGVAVNLAPYAKTKFDKSPLLNKVEQGAPGLEYQLGLGHTVLSESRANTSSDQVIHWIITSSGEPKGNGYYPVGSLAIAKVTDENGKEVYTYTDREGREVLKVGYQNTSTPVKTYYVYDDRGNLRFTIPPMAVNEIGTNSTITLTAAHATRTTWLTEMKYDGYNRLIEKKIPESDPVYTVYDRLGRIVMAQQGLMRSNNEWFYTKYDIRGRVVMTGVYVENVASRQSRQGMQDYFDNWSGPVWESKTSSNYDEQHGYTHQVYPTDLSRIVPWKITYYDDYDFDNDGTADHSFEANTEFTSLTGSNRSKHEVDLYRLDGQVTGTKTRILEAQRVFENDNGEYGYGHPVGADSVYYIGTTNNNYSITLKPGFRTKPGQYVRIGSSDIAVPPSIYDDNGEWLTGVSFFDKYGRTIFSKRENHLGGEDKSWTLYHYDGEIERTKQTHLANGVTTTVKNRFEYDHAGRLLVQYQQNNSDTEMKILENDYNEIDQLTQKKLHNTSGANWLQTLDYTYHKRGWLSRINDPSSLGSDLFAYALTYDDSTSGQQSLQKYNGNIVAMEWSNKIGGVTKRHKYSYTYDGLYQLTEAKMSIWNSSSNSWITSGTPYNTLYSYDVNGNIQTLLRGGVNNGVAANMDNLIYTYSGNQVKNVSDSHGNDAAGFINGVDNVTEYFYDINGNMIKDDNKGIASIIYNRLNLPEAISFTNGYVISYTYDSEGVKLSKVTNDGNGGIIRTDYSNGFVYADNQLDFFSFLEGRVRKVGNSFQYEYDISDHLGNVRTTFKDDAGSPLLLQADAYYPFGAKMPELGYVASGSDENKYTYNGKELEDENGLNWYHYGLRFYDPILARWWVIDPKDVEHGSYNYSFNDPIRFIDPDGGSPMDINIRDQNGALIVVIKSKKLEGDLYLTNVNLGDGFPYNPVPMHLPFIDDVANSLDSSPSPFMPDASILSIGYDVSMGLGFSAGRDLIFPLTGPDAGDIIWARTTGFNFGLDFGASAVLGNVFATGEKEFLTASDFEGPSTISTFGLVGPHALSVIHADSYSGLQYGLGVGAPLLPITGNVQWARTKILEIYDSNASIPIRGVSGTIVNVETKQTYTFKDE